MLNQSIGTNGTLHEEYEVELDTECFLLLGLLFCRDRYNRKAQVFYSLLKSGSIPFQSSAQLSMVMQHNGHDNFDELYCLDDTVENIIFKICVLSNSFVEYYALPLRPGRTEYRMLETAFAMRSNVYFKVFQTFIQHISVEPEKFFVQRGEFLDRMREYPLKHFLSPSTFRNMIALQMPQQATGIMRNKTKFNAGNRMDLCRLEIKSRPKL